MWSQYQHVTVQRVDDVLVIGLLDPKLFDTIIVSQLQDELLLLVETEGPERLQRRGPGGQFRENWVLKDTDHAAARPLALEMHGFLGFEIAVGGVPNPLNHLRV